VNASPSLSAEHATDLNLKRQLLHDTLDVIDIEDVRSGKGTFKIFKPIIFFISL
jgi:hypothetical protein